jgi:multimeric flavodoxin WrbA
MKIVAINSSYKGDNGHTAVLLDHVLRGASSAGAECEVVTLAHLKLNRCLACDICQSKEHYLKCVQGDKDDVQMVFDKIAGADLVIYATPVYVFTISALLKVLFDRMYGICDVKKLLVTKSGLLYHHTNREICGKPFAAVICCDNLEDETPKNLVSYFKTFAKFQDAHLAGILVRNAGLLAAHGKNPALMQSLPKLAEVYKAYEDAGRELATMQNISKSTQKKVNQEIVPVRLFHMMKKLRPFKRKFIEHAQNLINTA